MPNQKYKRKKENPGQTSTSFGIIIAHEMWKNRGTQVNKFMKTKATSKILKIKRKI